MQGNKILITGSLGLIGRELEKQLKILGIPMQGIDLLYPADHPLQGDIRDVEKLTELAVDCIGIVHLAAVSRVIAGEQNPERCWDVNVNGTQKVLEVAQKSRNKPWVLYASSREVYGQQPVLPVKENDPRLPCNIYARSKVGAEDLMQAYRRKGLQIAILRFSNVYGRTQDYEDRVIPAFCKASAFGGSIRIDGGHNTFDFTYIDDVIDGILKMIQKLQQGYCDLPPMHLTSGKGTTLLEAAEYAKGVSKFDIDFVEAPSRTFDVATFYGDPTLAHDILGWQAKVGIREGISLLVKSFEKEGFHAAKSANL